MTKRHQAAIVAIVSGALLLSRATSATESEAQQIISLERAALDRWGNGDPQGYLNLDAPGITYFDPGEEKRVDGLEAMKRYLEPLTGKIRIKHYDMIDPRVQMQRDAAVLTFQFISEGSEGKKYWNCTEVYARVDRKWQIIHTHWSFIKPQLKTDARPAGAAGPAAESER